MPALPLLPPPHSSHLLRSINDAKKREGGRLIMTETLISLGMSAFLSSMFNSLNAESDSGV
jgi:hypothetical protein